MAKRRQKGGLESLGRGLERRTKVERSAETIGEKIGGYLEELNEWEQQHARRRGVIPFDYSEARESIRALPKDSDTSVIFDALFARGVPLGVQQTMIGELQIKSADGRGPFKITESQIKDRFFGAHLVSDANLSCRRGGEEWLETFVRERRGGKHFDLNDAHRVQTLARSVPEYGADTVATTRLMFILGSDDPDGEGESLVFHSPVEKLDTIIGARRKEAPGKQIDAENNFFEQMQNFISVYSDITHQVMQGIKSSDERVKIGNSAKTTLSRLLQSEAFQLPYWNKYTGPPSPFEVFQNMLHENVRNNPWITADCTDTPFDVSRFGLLFTRDAPRGLVAEAVIGLNDYPKEVRALRARTLIDALHEGGQITDQMTPDEVRDRRIKRRSAMGQSAGLINEYLKLNPDRQKDQSPPADEAEGEDKETKALRETGDILKEIESLGTWRGKIELQSNNQLHPFATLLRIIDPQKIVADRELQHQFVQLFAQIDTPSSTDQARVLAVSIREALNPEKYDSSLDLPLLGTHDQLPLSTLIIQQAFSNLDPDTIKHGVDSLDGKDGSPLFQPPALREYDAVRLAAAKKNFDSASGTSPDFLRLALIRAGQEWGHPDNYEEILSFATAEEKKFRGVSDNYAVAFYRSATAAMGDFLGSLLRFEPGARVFITNQEYNSITKEFTKRRAHIGDHEILYMNKRDSGRSKTALEIFDQFRENIEAPGRHWSHTFPTFRENIQKELEGGKNISQTLTKFEEGVVAGSEARKKLFVDFRAMLGEGKTSDDVFEEFREQVAAHIEANKVPVAFVMSTETRFGDAPCGGGNVVPNIDGMRTLIRLIKTEFPAVLIAGDLSQSLGRNDAGENQIEKVGFDVVFDSGSKAGIPNTSTLIIRTKYPRNIPSWLDPLDEETRKNPVDSLQYRQATEYIPDIAAMALLKQEHMGQVNPWSLDSIPEGSSAREEIAKIAQRQTRYFLKKIEDYVPDLFTNPQLEFPIPFSEQELGRLGRHFGCEVSYPIHRDEGNYNGIVTISLPTIPAVVKQSDSDGKIETIRDYLSTELSRKGFAVLPCLKEHHAIRVSFRPTHGTEEIDALVQAIQEVQVEYLREIVRIKEIKTLAELVDATKAPTGLEED